MRPVIAAAVLYLAVSPAPPAAAASLCVELEPQRIGPVYLPPPVGPISYTTPYQEVCVL